MLLSLLPPDMTATVFSVLLTTSFAASFITVAFGIGGGTVLLAVLATLLPPVVLIPVHGVVMAGSNLGRLATLLGFVSWRNLPGFVAGSVIGVAGGGVVVINIPPAMVQIGVGLFIIWSVFSKAPVWMRKWSVLTGAISSFLTMFFGATGLFVAAFTKSLALERHAHVATHAALMTVQHILKTIVFGLLGFSFGPWLAFVISMIVVGFVGTLAGRIVLNQISDARFRWALNAILLLTSLRLIWAGLVAL